MERAGIQDAGVMTTVTRTLRDAGAAKLHAQESAETLSPEATVAAILATLEQNLAGLSPEDAAAIHAVFEQATAEVQKQSCVQLR